METLTLIAEDWVFGLYEVNSYVGNLCYTDASYCPLKYSVSLNIAL